MLKVNELVSELREWLIGCPAFEGNYTLGIDNLGANPLEYSIEVIPNSLNYTVDILGDINYEPIQEINFVLASRELYSANVLNQLSNLGFFDDVTDWMNKQNAIKNFPKIEGGEIVSIMPITTQFLFESEARTGKYQMQCNIKYFKGDE